MLGSGPRVQQAGDRSGTEMYLLAPLRTGRFCRAGYIGRRIWNPILKSIPPASVQGVVLSYNSGVQHVFYMVSGTAAAAFVLSWGLGWGSVEAPEVDSGMRLW